MSSRFSGMTINERLFVIGMSKEFQFAVDSGDEKRAHEILDMIELPDQKVLWPQPSGILAIKHHFASATSDEALALRDRTIREFETAKDRGDYDALRSIFLRLGIEEASLEWPLDARSPRT